MFCFAVFHSGHFNRVFRRTQMFFEGLIHSFEKNSLKGAVKREPRALNHDFYDLSFTHIFSFFCIFSFFVEEHNTDIVIMKTQLIKAFLLSLISYSYAANPNPKQCTPNGNSSCELKVRHEHLKEDLSNASSSHFFILFFRWKLNVPFVIQNTLVNLA